MGSSATRDRSHGLESLSVIAKVIPADGNSRQVTLHTARGIAALAVCWYHLVMSGGVAMSAGLALARYGQFGVEAFFVISGFLITGGLFDCRDRGGMRLSEFYARRARRLLPALVLVLAVVLAAGWVLTPPTEYAQAGRRVVRLVSAETSASAGEPSATRRVS